MEVEVLDQTEIWMVTVSLWTAALPPSRRAEYAGPNLSDADQQSLRDVALWSY